MTCPAYTARPVDGHWIYYGPVQRCCGSCQLYVDGKCRVEDELCYDHGWRRSPYQEVVPG